MTTTSDKATENPRLPFLDGLRGLAVLGILIMNIQAFGRPEWAYLLPDITGPLSVADRWLHGLGYFLAEQVFVSLFSCLFGIGIWILAERDVRRQRDPIVHQRRRSLGLLAIGLVHAYLIWSGDILVAYALAAWVLAPSVYWPVQRQAQLGLMFLAVTPALALLEVGLLSAEARSAAYNINSQDIQAEIDALTGSWWKNQGWRFSHSLEAQLLGLPLGTFWFVSGWMLIGMALFRQGFAAGAWSPERYRRYIALALVAGLTLKATGYVYQAGNHFSPATLALGHGLFSYLGALCLALAYIGLAVLGWHYRPLPALGRLLQAIGRLALSNYILQSLVATSLFYGFGLGWFGGTSLVGLLLATIGIWLINAAFSLLWLRWFHCGPLEWLWRWHSRGQAPAFKR